MGCNLQSLVICTGMLAGFFASMCESVGDYYACARLVEVRPPSERMVNVGIGMEGIGCLLAGIWGMHCPHSCMRHLCRSSLCMQRPHSQCTASPPISHI